MAYLQGFGCRSHRLAAVPAKISLSLINIAANIWQDLHPSIYFNEN